MSAGTAPAFLAVADSWGEVSAPGVAARVAGGMRGDVEVGAGLARECADWVAADFEAACPALLAGSSAGGEGDGGPAEWLELRRRLRAGPGATAVVATRGARALLHAALVGLARGASRDAFAYAGARKVRDRPLIQLELLSARLSAIATDEAIAELQLGCLCELLDGPDGDAAAEAAQAEIRRASLAAVVEGAQVHGGHGFVQRQEPGRRVELAQAVHLWLAGPAEGVPR